jgi:hypothetical protein
MGKQAQVCRNFVRRRAERSQWRKDINVDLARICLRRDWVCVREVRHLCYESIEFLYLVIAGIIRGKGDTAQNLAYLVMVAIKQREEASLRSRGAFHAAETQIVPRPLNVAEVPEQFLGSDKISISNSPVGY